MFSLHRGQAKRFVAPVRDQQEGPVGHGHVNPPSRNLSLLVCSAALVAIAACSPGGDSGPPVPVVWTDGVFEEWVGVAPAVVDLAGDVPPGSPVDLGAVFMRDDPRFVHLLIDLGDTVTVQGMPGTVEIVLDADGDAGTGESHGGVAGADLAIVLSRQEDPAADVHGAGVGVRWIDEGGADEIDSAPTVGLLVSPTHSSDRFEVRLDRLGMRRDRFAERSDEAGAVYERAARPAVGAGRVLSGRLRYLRAGAVVDETPVFTHKLATEPGEAPPLLDGDAVARTPNTLRVVTWNVSDGNFRDHPEPFRRVLAALAPDVVLLDEVYADVTMADLSRFSRGLGPVSESSWNWWLAAGGGRQRTAVGAQRLELRGETALARVDHPPGALERWLREVGDEPESPRMPPPSRLARAEAAGGLSATGAWVTVDGQAILFVPVDLQSAGYDGSPRDRLRELQARTLNQAIAAVLADRPDAELVIGGDLNVVGSARPLEALRSGLGVTGGDLSIARLERLRDRSLATWRSTRAGDPFSPGRLDYVLYRGTVLRIERAFIFDAADLSPAALEQLGVRESDTLQSDHLPLVVDFTLR